VRHPGLTPKQRAELAWATRALLVEAARGRTFRTPVVAWGRGIAELLPLPNPPISERPPATMREARQHFHREIRRAARLFAGLPS
jgi:hypothetical protein